MEIQPLEIPDVLLVKPKRYGDERGFFIESWNRSRYADAGIGPDFVQDNHSRSRRHVLRGLHFQYRQPQGKLVRVVSGSVFDVAVDLRRSSPFFGHWVGAELTAENGHQMWIPAGFAHGFLVLSETVDFLYKCTAFYSPEDERSLLWNDPAVSVRWPLDTGVQPILSSRDSQARALRDVETFV